MSRDFVAAESFVSDSSESESVGSYVDSQASSSAPSDSSSSGSVYERLSRRPSAESGRTALQGTYQCIRAARRTVPEASPTQRR